MEKEEYAKIQKSELKELASKLLNDEIYFVEGVRNIKDRLHTISLDDDDINLFRGIDSDTDDVPVGDTRKLWSADALRKIDDEIVDYIDKVKPQVKEVCKKIIKIVNES
jgi:hypothetical protein